jgi:hypothetical protein
VPAEPTPPIASPHPALEAMLTRPRLAGLTAAPDGSLLVVGVATPAPGATRYRTCLWAIDPDGADPARQLTRSAAGEALATFLSGGDLLFTSARPDPDAEEPPTDPPAALWRLPRTGGEAELLLAPSGGVRGIWTANDREVVVVAVDLHRDATTLEEDAEREKARRDAGVTARLYEPGEYPVRFWDRWLGPREPSLWVLDLTDDDRTDDPATRGRPRLLARGAALRDAEVALDAAGTTVVTTWARSGRRRSPEDLVSDLVAIDLVSGQRRVLVADGRAYAAPAVAPDGHRLVCVAADLGAPDRAPEQTLVLVPLAEDGTAETVRDLTPDWDRWPEAPRWSADGTAVLCTADDEGQAPVFRVDPRDGTVTRLTAEGAYAELCLPPSGPAGRWLRPALHGGICAPTGATRARWQRPAPRPAALPGRNGPGHPGRARGGHRRRRRAGRLLAGAPGRR